MITFKKSRMSEKLLVFAFASLLWTWNLRKWLKRFMPWHMQRGKKLNESEYLITGSMFALSSPTNYTAKRRNKKCCILGLDYPSVFPPRCLILILDLLEEISKPTGQPYPASPPPCPQQAHCESWLGNQDLCVWQSSHIIRRICGGFALLNVMS